MPQTWTYAVTIRHYKQSEFDAVPLDGYRVTDFVHTVVLVTVATFTRQNT